MGIKKSQEPTPRLTLCLAMDLKGSTQSGMRLSTRKLDKFNMALVEQLSPHLRAVQLEHALVKFTGDGWLVMSEEQTDAAPLCCLSMIMARNFQRDMAIQTGLPVENIPSLRLAVCWGRDIQVTLPDGRKDFVGNSVRHAVRACQICYDNEILVDDTVRNWIKQDFHTGRCDSEDRLREFSEAKWEEELILHTLEELKSESVEDADAPLYFVNTLSIIGRSSEAEALANRISDQLLSRAGTGADQSELLERWNALIATATDYDTAREALADLRRAGLRPDVQTYNALIDKALDFRDQSRWLQSMVQDGVTPNTATYNVLLRRALNESELERRIARMTEDGVPPDTDTLMILVERAADFETAESWANDLIGEGVLPSAATFGLLIARAPDFGTARDWLEKMIRLGLEPSDTSFIDVFSKDLDAISAEDLLKWYLSLPYHPTHPIKRAIAQYRRKGRIEDALRLALDYPHTDTALRTIRQYPDQALSYFRSIVDADPDHPNGAYALGMALIETGVPEEAEVWLRRAYELAAPGTRKDEIARYLSLIERVFSSKTSAS